MTQWPSLIESLPFTDAQRGKLLAHLEANASVAAWRRRAARRKPASGEGA
jgi:serine/threonine-protein kinase HipA